MIYTRRRTSGTLSLSVLTLCIFAACAVAEEAALRSEVLIECDRGLGGAAIGDLDADAPGNEVVAVNSVGEAYLAKRVGNDWKAERIYKGDGEMIMCAIGDVDPTRPGNELVGVGMVSGEESLSGAGQVTMVYADGSGYAGTPIFIDSHMLHGVAVGDVSNRADGDEVVVCGFNHLVTLLHWEGGRWHHETIYVGNDRMKIVAIADAIPDRPGLEVVACGSSGEVVVLWEGALGWHHQVVFDDQIGQSRVTVGSAGILAGGDRGKLTLANLSGGCWQTEFVARDSAKIRGVAFADSDGRGDGELFYSAGYSRNVLRHKRGDNGCWQSAVVYSSSKPLHHLVVGEFDASHAGCELLTCGHEGKLVALYP